jgi:hypothetical protein
MHRARVRLDREHAIGSRCYLCVPEESRMPSHLAPCAQCRRYIRSNELACPFCSAAQTTPELQATPRMARGAALVLSMALAGCGQAAEPSAPLEAPTVVEVAPAIEVPVEPPRPVEPAPVEPVVEAAPEVPAVAEPPAEPPAPPPPTPAIVRPQPVRPMMARYGRPPVRRGDDDPFAG